VNLALNFHVGNPEVLPVTGVVRAANLFDDRRELADSSALLPLAPLSERGPSAKPTRFTYRLTVRSRIDLRESLEWASRCTRSSGITGSRLVSLP
jgi:hypothetical protein